MGYSRIEYPYAGGARDFVFSPALGLLDIADVQAYVVGEVDGLGDQVYRAFTWPSADTVRITDAIPNPCAVVVQRTVSKTELEINFEGTGTVTKNSLQRGFKQLLMNIHELLDGRLDSFTGAALDAITGLKDLAQAARVGAEAALATTLTYRDTASTYATTATTKAGEALASAAEALGYRNTASTHAGTATTKAAEADADAATAVTQAGIATTKAGEASTSATTATTQAGTATTQAGIATTQAGIATTKAGAADASAIAAAAAAGSMVLASQAEAQARTDNTKFMSSLRVKEQAETYGLGIITAGPLLANLDATTIPTGTYRFDAGTTGTFPAGITAANTGVVEVWRGPATNAIMEIYNVAANRRARRRMTSGSWQSWREVIEVNDSATRGSTIRRGASDWDRLPLGTNGRVLRSDGTDVIYGAEGFLYSLGGDLVGSDVTTVQPILGVGVTVEANTLYEYCLAARFSKSVGATSHDFTVLFGGTATYDTVNNRQCFLRHVGGVEAHTHETDMAAGVGPTGVSGAGSFINYTEHGVFNAIGAGTVIPRYKLSVAPGGAYSVRKRSFFRLRAIGAATGGTVIMGPWA